MSNSKGVILAVDDTPESLRMLMDILTADGYTVRPADSGELALASVAASPPELILLDIRMPDIDGLEVCRRLKARAESRDIPVMFISAATELEERVEGLQAGAVDFVSKPFQREELLARVQTHLELSRLRVSLQRAYAEMEERVRQRTAELEDRNRELRESEERLRESERKLRAVFDHTLQFVGLMMPDGTLIEANRGALELAGVEKSAVVGRPFWETAWWRHSAELRERLRAAIQTASQGQFVRFEATHAAFDGTLVDVDFSLTPVRNDVGQVVLLIPEGHDLTERNRAEAALRESERKQAEAEKQAATGRMAACVAHEINNPLAGIRNSFRLIKDAVPADHPDYDMVGRIEREIDRIANIVRQMYTLYSPRAERTAEVLVAEAIRDVLVMLEPIRREHEARFEQSRVSPGLSVRIPPGALHQIVYNLAANAIEASPRRGIVTVAAKLADDIGEDHGVVEISVQDEGAGIPPELRARVFEPFFTSKTEDHSTPGLGLGLSVVKNIVESVGGRIDFKSTHGKGTVFRVLLPQPLQTKEL